MIPTVAWGTGNMGRAAVRGVDAHPDLDLVAVVVADPAKVGRDAGDLALMDAHLGVAATDDLDAVLAAGPEAVVYAVSGACVPRRPPVTWPGHCGPGPWWSRRRCTPCTTPRSAPPELHDPLAKAAADGGGALFVSGIAPDWPQPPEGAEGAHRVVIEGRPRIEVTFEAADEDGRAAGGNATAVGRLVNAIPWLRAAAPGIYNANDVPLLPAAGRIRRSTP